MNFFKKILSFSLLFSFTMYEKAFAASTGFFGSCISVENIKNGEISSSNIPCILQSSINFLMGFAGTIAVIFIIIGAYQILFGSLEQNQSKGKSTILMALGGFALASLSWLIIKLILDNFS